MEASHSPIRDLSLVPSPFHDPSLFFAALMPTQLMESGEDWDLFHLHYTQLGTVDWETHTPAYL